MAVRAPGAIRALAGLGVSRHQAAAVAVAKGDVAVQGEPAEVDHLVFIYMIMVQMEILRTVT